MAIFTNQATLSYQNNVTNSNIVTGEIQEVLSATKTAVMDNYRANDSIAYVVSIVNSGSVAHNDLTLTDNLGAYSFTPAGSAPVTLYPLTYVEDSVKYFINGVLQTTELNVVAGPPLIIGGIDVPANSNVIIIYEASVNNFAPLEVGDTINNQVLVFDSILSASIEAEDTITAEEYIALTISKSLSPDTVVENGELTYTFIIQNTGNTAANADADVVLSDTFDPILNFISVSVNGVTLDASSYTYDTDTGEFATDEGVITVPAATFTQDPVNGSWIITPGITIVTIIGTV